MSDMAERLALHEFTEKRLLKLLHVRDHGPCVARLLVMV